MGKVTASIRVADEVWIATALLHREHPEAADFSLQEIAARLEREALTEIRRPGVYPHLSVHCVANRPPTTGTYRMLFETAPSRRRLFRAGDPYDPRRQGGKIVPNRAEIPPLYHELVDWYERTWAPAATSDPLLELAARSRGLWKGVNADDYVRRLREGFE
ncbi:MAG: hypothetical protein A3F70_16695 [Acidobacteria bacterium RIFCSPLOWO2_12_FULL_67_14]|nr:MAG: hypothetical protein A3H29_11215 [Acidobacteria bacterium RIFCSPLOWO2_02_FULL_67_21]OFW37344.1 MAG: hypothetical protein A3F70_16695 [Acidobacteria bacterium RIFCSPLOWO2_12_FULL_67_14]